MIFKGNYTNKRSLLFDRINNENKKEVKIKR